MSCREASSRSERIMGAAIRGVRPRRRIQRFGKRGRDDFGFGQEGALTTSRPAAGPGRSTRQRHEPSSELP
jgi:hypothetical protein